ncbi:MAG: DUF1402 family protein [Pseudomonadota bacterium]
MVRLLLAVFLAVALQTTNVALAASISVPPGNRHAKQPAIPSGAYKRTRSSAGSFDAKYRKIRNLLARDKKLMKKIKSAARKFGIDPIHIVGALVGEHTYNVDALDRFQTYYVKALAYLGESISFGYKRTSIKKMMAKPQFSKCTAIRDSYDKWSCRETVWNKQFRGKRVDGIAWPNDRFGRVFFQPKFAGQTFGLGQLNPLTALKVSDMVARKSRFRKLNENNAPQVYKAIMDPDSTLLYMAAVIRNSIDTYNKVAGFDISKNPGITATLYNLGNVRARAYQLRAKNKARRAQGKKPILPQENYYGWLVNSKAEELRGLL